ncbi:MAG TPA: family 20 glycosylhydrolase, partial [Flavobacterium sp.]|nr:family 20 glycosylhydrolase [Flavobacterium sp.]
WHLVDDQGWRIEMKKNKKLIELASDGQYYTQEEIKNIVKYADERGILVVPEIDVPGNRCSWSWICNTYSLPGNW